MHTKDNSKNIKSASKLNIIIIGLLVVIVLVIAYKMFFQDLFKDRNTKMEEEMVLKAQEYVNNNSISVNKEIYLDVSKLNVTLDDDCSYTSGVLYDGTSFHPNLVCQNYKSSVISTNNDIKDYITLKGEEITILAKGMNYYDPGYISNDIVITAGNVGTEEGVYNVYYKTKNSDNVAIRKVIIIDNQVIRNLFPTITLKGEEVVYLVEGNRYEELGVTAKDTVDGNLSSSIITEGKVNINNVGEYNINYLVTNSRGYTNSITRKVIVLSRESDLVIGYTITPMTYTNEDVTIKLSVSNEYNRIIYPDGREGTMLNYVVTENGTYTFSVYDDYNRVVTKEIVIDNIDRTIPEGSCTATLYYNRTQVDVSITSEREISSYEYFINGVSTGTTQSKSYNSSTAKPSVVKVKVKDSINNQTELTCNLVNKLTREIVSDAKGKQCLEGLTCYVQNYYGDITKYPYCSMPDDPRTCGGISRSGCSITATTNAIAAMGVKSRTGVLHTPYTVWEELYPVNHRTGECNGGCSAWTRMREAVINAGLSAPRKIISLNRTTMSQVTEHLKKGYPVILHAGAGPFSASKGHYLSLLGIREDGYVFISDSSNQSGTFKNTYKGKKYFVDTWIPTDDLISGNIDNALLVGPPGMYEGK